MYLLFAILIISLKALAEGLATSGHKDIAGVITVIWFAGLVISFWLWQTGTITYQKRQFKVLLNVLLGFALLHFSIFDWVWNFAAGQDLDYIGVTKFWDKFINSLFVKVNFDPVLWQIWKMIAGLIGASLLVKFNNKKYII